MRIILFADAHIGQYREFDTQDSRLERCLNALEAVLRYARDTNADLVIDAGDLLDKKNLIDFTVYNRLYRLLAKWHVTPDWMWSLVGNHNMATYDGAENNLEPLKRLVTVVDEPQIMWSNNYPIALMPFRRRNDQWLADWNRLIEQAVPCSLCVAHQEIKGAVTGTHRYVAAGGVEPAVLPGPYDYVVLGHYHRFQFIEGTNSRAFYLGALLQQDFGEEGNPQVFWEYDTDTKLWKYHTINSPRFLTVLEVDDIPAEPTDFYRLQAEVNNPEDLTLTPAQRRTVRVEVQAPQETLQRLNPAAYGSMSDLIEAYVQSKVPEGLRQAVRTIYHTLRHERT